MFLVSCKSGTGEVSSDSKEGIIHIDSFPSQLINPRGVDIWLPSDYDSTKKYVVIYMHDAQMLFDGTKTWSGKEWNVDETMSDLSKNGKIKDAIVVAIENDGAGRPGEYFPEAILKDVSAEQQTKLLSEFLNGNAEADEYIMFIVHELKPYIDSTYSTLSDQSNTFIIGSSMGGLISLYAICEYPQIFGGAACISTHWPVWLDERHADYKLDQAFLKYLNESIPSPDRHKIYFDHGTATLDSMYKPIQMRVDSIMVNHGYTGNNWMTREFPGEDHSEVSWSKRFHIPVEFLIGK